MKYIIGVLCVAYLPAYSFAEQLQDHTNTATPRVPDAINSKNKYAGVKVDRQEQNLNFTQLFLNVSVNANASEDLVSVKQAQDGKLYIRARDLKALRLKMDEHIS
ncbi:fimbrial biogenesis outer membrane usher protein, partial [Acinetobacter lactucae]|nr:fimbrial biogenesis outer membrane usher protein [Acinetobacter lactucae]